MKTTINYILAVMALMVSSFVAQAQVKIGNNPTIINGGSLLELESTDKGLLMPRINLTNTSTWGLAGIPAAGMHVYNTNTSITSTTATCPTLGAKIGEYYWDGSCWVALGQETSVIKPYFKAISASYTPGRGGVTVTNFTETADDLNNFSPTSGVFTASESGYYLFSYSTNIPNSGGGVIVQELSRNNVRFGTDRRNAVAIVNYPQNLSTSYFVKLTAGDSVTLVVAYDANVGSGSVSSEFSAVKL